MSKTGNAAVDQFFSRGGMASLLTTVWLVLAALSFAAIMEHAGFLERLLQPVVARAPTRGRLILAINASGIGLNVIAGDQYVADVLPARMFRDEYERRGLAPQVLSRAVEDSGTVTSVLVPWNTCGAYISGVLGVSTASYLPYCFFNLLSPILDIAYGFIGFKVPSATPEPPGSEQPSVVAPTPPHVAATVKGRSRQRSSSCRRVTHDTRSSRQRQSRVFSRFSQVERSSDVRSATWRAGIASWRASFRRRARI